MSVMLALVLTFFTIALMRRIFIDQLAYVEKLLEQIRGRRSAN